MRTNYVVVPGCDDDVMYIHVHIHEDVVACVVVVAVVCIIMYTSYRSRPLTYVLGLT